ncbi:C-type lectin domain family 4 member M-like [Oncorhynchus mykiss]|uniref:C-type lectin domain family 4 member M-like n=1 Tax=Oncorhynchus mykiss TaxID=8022 RepID=UPI0018782E01|nr:C-type lectin domain family 4 member M-like [Oncorhynchus mykiss]
MEMSENIYTNIDSIFEGDPCGRRAANRDEDINEDSIIFQDSRDAAEDDDTCMGRPAANPSGSKSLGRRPSRAGDVCWGLLCVLLLAGIISLGFYRNTVMNSYKDNLTKEKNQLETSNNNLTTERDQLQTSYKNMTKKRNQLQVSYNKLRAKSSQLQTSYNIMTKERDQLQTSYNTVNKERDQLQTSYNTMNKERDQLQTSYNNLAEEIDQLKTERDLLQKRFSGLKRAGPKGWTLFQSTWYYISSEVKSWDESRQDCNERGADLVIINSKEEQTFLTNLNKRIWIGLTDKDKEGTWKWVDGTPLTTSYWMGKNPDNKMEEDCAEISIGPVEGNWDDFSCATHLNRICEQKH